jgi:hypothetical protein
VPALAEAIRRMLTAPPDAAALRQAAAEYSMSRSSRRYLDVLLGDKALQG